MPIWQLRFLCGLNQTRSLGLMNKLANSYLNGRDKYLKKIVAAYNLVLNWAGGKLETIGNNNAVTLGTNDELDKIQHHNGKIRRRGGQLVKCVIYGGNHCPNKCLNKKNNDNGQDKETSDEKEDKKKKRIPTLRPMETTKLRVQELPPPPKLQTLQSAHLLRIGIRASAVLASSPLRARKIIVI